MAELLIPGQTIGIVGGDALARFLALAAKSIGYRVGILAPEADCMAANVADWQIVAAYDDVDGMLKLANRTDMLTFSAEPIDLFLLQQLEGLVKIPQTFEFLEVTQDRFLEREFLDVSNINVVPHARIYEIGDVEAQIDAIGFPSILKVASPKLGSLRYHTLERITDLKGCLPLLAEGPCILEAKIAFDKELIVMLVGNGKNETTTYPIMETIYNSLGQLKGYQVSENLDPDIAKEVERIANLVAVTFNLQGMLSIELLLAENGILYVNSLKAGPHDAGYVTLEATNLSQFQAHIRGICGWPLPAIDLFSPALVLTVNSEQLVETLGQIPFRTNWYHHYYQPSLSETLYAVGHVTILANDLALERQILKETQIWQL